MVFENCSTEQCLLQATCGCSAVVVAVVLLSADTFVKVLGECVAVTVVVVVLDVLVVDCTVVVFLVVAVVVTVVLNKGPHTSP